MIFKGSPSHVDMFMTSADGEPRNGSLVSFATGCAKAGVVQVCCRAANSSLNHGFFVISVVGSGSGHSCGSASGSGRSSVSRSDSIVVVVGVVAAVAVVVAAVAVGVGAMVVAVVV